MPQATDLEFQFNVLKQSPSDTNEHMQVLRNCANECGVCVEFGVRWVVTTWALVAAKPQRVISYDITTNSTMQNNLAVLGATAQANGVQFDFYQQDVTQPGFLIPQCDLLYVDIWPEYSLYYNALNNHYSRVSKYIIIHGINNPRDEDGNPGTTGPYLASEEFLIDHPEWTKHQEYRNVHGLVILKRN